MYIKLIGGIRCTSEELRWAKGNAASVSDAAFLILRILGCLPFSNITLSNALVSKVPHTYNTI